MTFCPGSAFPLIITVCQAEKLRCQMCTQPAAQCTRGAVLCVSISSAGKMDLHTHVLSHFFLVWIQTVGLCECVWICVFLFCPDLFIKRKTHLHKKSLRTQEESLLCFPFCSIKTWGVLASSEGVWRLLSSQTRLFPPIGKLSFFFPPRGRGVKCICIISK